MLDTAVEDTVEAATWWWPTSVEATAVTLVAGWVVATTHTLAVWAAATTLTLVAGATSLAEAIGMAALIMLRKAIGMEIGMATTITITSSTITASTITTTTSSQLESEGGGQDTDTATAMVVAAGCITRR